MGLLGGLGFGAPLILLALIVLPAIWWLLRVTPPSPRRVIFPPLRILLGLAGKEETSAHTPWWLLLLRLIAAACVIIALAEPLLGQPQPIAGSGPIVLVIDNGWSAAANWDARQATIADVLRTAQRTGRAVALVPTSELPDLSLMDAGQAQRQAQALAPVSWVPDRARIAVAIRKVHFASRPDILWLSDGMEDGHATELSAALSAAGNLHIYADAPG